MADTDGQALSRGELAYEYAPEKWGELMPAINDLPEDQWPAIFRSWLDEKQAGRDRGRPLSGETGLRSGGVYQTFERGDCLFKDGRVSWRG